MPLELLKSPVLVISLLCTLFPHCWTIQSYDSCKDSWLNGSRLLNKYTDCGHTVWNPAQLILLSKIKHFEMTSLFHILAVMLLSLNVVLYHGECRLSFSCFSDFFHKSKNYFKCFNLTFFYVTNPLREVFGSKLWKFIW